MKNYKQLRGTQGEEEKMGNDTAGGGDINQTPETRKGKRDYKGFVAGVFSGITKLSGECRVHNYISNEPLIESERILNR